MKLYVYCLAEGVETVAEPLRGISGAPVRLLRIENVAALVSDLENDVVQVSRENVLDHAAVVRSVFDRTTPLPFRFGTIVTEEQLKNYASTRRPTLETKLAHVRDCVEMSVKIIWDVSHDEQEAQSVTEEGAGAAFLAEKRREILGDEHRAVAARGISTWLQQRVEGLVRDEHVSLRPNEKLVLAAAHLVERAKINQYREKMAEARENRPELHFLLSGPWPPYSFANIELEFKTQFGVS